VQLDDKLPDIHALLGGIYLFQRQYDKAIAEGQRAIALGPNIACNKAILARTMLFAGRFEEARKLVKSAMRLNPRYPSWYLDSLAMAYGVMGEHEKAIGSYRELLNLRRNTRGNIVTPLLGLAANCMILGREDEARTHAGEILEVNPAFSLEWFRKVNLFRDPSHLKPFLEALHRAGLPD
jgi:tetratricopeptide (TPR) repeat protein